MKSELMVMLVLTLSVGRLGQEIYGNALTLRVPKDLINHLTP